MRGPPSFPARAAFALALSLPSLVALPCALACARDVQPREETQPASPRAAPARTEPAAGELFASRGAVVIETASGPLRFAVELALTDRERQHGLMFREHLDDDAGMLFIFERQRLQSFWMKNTRIPLDMIFIDAGGEIAGIVEGAEPLTLSARRVDKPSRYVLELNGGAARRLGIAPGQHVRFEGVPPELVDPRVLSSASSTPPAAPSPAPSPSSSSGAAP